MIVLAITCYFLLFAGLASLLVFAPARVAVGAFLIRLGRSLATATRVRTRSLVLSPLDRLRSLVDGSVVVLSRHRKTLAITLTVLVGPALAVLSLGGETVFEYADEANVPHPQIAALLQGERLAPPPPLAPEIFTTREVTLVRPTARWASRDWELLDDVFRQRLLSVFKLMREVHGYDMVLLEGYRSPERQTSLAAMGRQTTQAGPGMSYHQYGLAADCAFLRNGQLVISEQDPWAMRGYALYGELADAAGLTWGGHWRMRDFGHVELRRPGVLQRLDG